VAKGADVNAKDQDGRTPLQCACNDEVKNALERAARNQGSAARTTRPSGSPAVSTAALAAPVPARGGESGAGGSHASRFESDSDEEDATASQTQAAPTPSPVVPAPTTPAPRPTGSPAGSTAALAAPAPAPALVSPVPVSASPILEWTVDEVVCFLESLGLGSKKQAFAQNAVNGRVLLAASDAELETDLGLSTLQIKRLRFDLAQREASTGCSHTYMAFLTHNWGEDAHGRDNHERVVRIYECLRDRGIAAWLDEERMEGNILDQMCRGIDDSATVVVFVTQKYMSKVGGRNDADNCKLEFNYAARHKAGSLIAVPMEPEVLDPKTWTGPVSMVLGPMLYKASFPTEEKDDPDAWRAALDALESEIRRRVSSSPRANA